MALTLQWYGCYYVMLTCAYFVLMSVEFVVGRWVFIRLNVTVGKAERLFE
jgi:hypothetical protein